MANNNEQRNIEPLLAFLLVALQDVCAAEIAKGPSISASAWRKLFDVCAALLGDEALPQAQPLVGRQPAVMPIHRQPIQIGAVMPQLGTPYPPSPVPAPALSIVVDPPVGDIRQRPDVAAELARVAEQAARVVVKRPDDPPPQKEGPK